MTKINKILVIGASIAGPAVCYWLKQFGFSPTLIEKNSTLRKGGYAIDIRGIAIQVAKQMGIYDKVCNMRTQLKFGRYVDANGNTLVEEEGEKFGFREGEEVEIVRGDLVEILMEIIQDTPCHFDQNITQIAQDEDKVFVHFSDGRTEQYDLVIGADGLHSTTRKMVFADHEYRLSELGSYLCVFNTPNYLNLNHSEILFESNHRLAYISSDKNPDEALAGFMFRSTYVFNDIRDESEQKNFLRDSFHNMGWEVNKFLQFMETSDNFYFDSITQVKMQSWTKGRVALVGDSGYCASPLSGQGTSLALAGAYILAGELRAAGENYEVAFERYNQLLHPFVEANQEFGVWVSKTFLADENVTQEAVAQRADNVIERMKSATNAIDLPKY